MKIISSQLSQKDANTLMCNLSAEPLENFRKAFHSEKENMLMKQRHFALPSHERVYYLITVEGVDYLLVGINPNPYSTYNTINISSFAKITTKLKCKAVDCLRELLESELVPMCQTTGKELIVSNADTKGSKTVFKNLKELKIKGIKKINIVGNFVEIEIEKM